MSKYFDMAKMNNFGLKKVRNLEADELRPEQSGFDCLVLGEIKNLEICC